MTPTFFRGTAHVRTPATSANLGPGYDAFGLALQWHDEIVAAVADSGLRVDVAGEGTAVARDESHLVVRAMRATFERLGAQPGGLELSCTNRIPHGRGLGSSASAIVSGVLAARALVTGGAELLPDADAFALAANLEGHPDNVAACFHGGLTLAWISGGRAEAIRTDVDSGVTAVVLVPPFESSTAAARGVLPDVVPHADAAFNAARAALLMAVLSGAVTPGAGTLLDATADRLHQPYRAAAMPATAELVALLRGEGLAAVVSGAGPTVLVLARDQVEVEEIEALAPAGWSSRAVPVDAVGAHVSSHPAASEPPE